MLVALLSGCGQSEEAKDARKGLRVAYDVMRGPPAESALSHLATFTDGNITFSYPKPLHASRERVGRDDVLAFAYGLYKAELWTSRAPQDAAGHVEAIADALVAMENAVILEPVARGQVLTICGQERTTATVRVRFSDVTSRYEAVVLPPTGGQRSRLLLFTDMRQDADVGWSRLADRSTQTILSTLQCKSPDEGSLEEDAA